MTNFRQEQVVRLTRKDGAVVVSPTDIFISDLSNYTECIYQIVFYNQRSTTFLFASLTEAARFVYSIMRLKAIVVQWSEHRLVTSEVAGSSPVSRELSLSYHAVATQSFHNTQDCILSAAVVAN